MLFRSGMLFDLPVPPCTSIWYLCCSVLSRAVDIMNGMAVDFATEKQTTLADEVYSFVTQPYPGPRSTSLPVEPHVLRHLCWLCVVLCFFALDRGWGLETHRAVQQCGLF